MNLIKSKKSKQKTKKSCTESNFVYNNYFTFQKCYNPNEFIKRSLDLKLNDLKDSKGKLELFYWDIIEIKPNNKDQVEDIEEKKVVFDTALELQNKLLRIYITQDDKPKKAKKKRIKVQNVPEYLMIYHQCHP